MNEGKIKEKRQKADAQKRLRHAHSLAVLAIIGVIFLVLPTVSVIGHSGGLVMSKKTATPINIDGIPKEPAWVAAFAQSSPTQDIAVDPRAHGQDWYQIIAGGGGGSNTNKGGLRVSRGQFDGNDDFLVRWATLWDDDYLYFAFNVADDSVHLYKRNYEARDGDIDGIWLLFDTKHDAPKTVFPKHKFETKKVASESTYQADDHYWIFAPLTGRGAGASWSQALDAGADPILNNPANKHVAGRITNTGYTAEIRLPWTVFKPFSGGLLLPGTVIGFDITLTDIDGDPPGKFSAPEGGAVAWSSDFENDNSPGVLGDLTISTELISVGTSVNPTSKLPTTWSRIKNKY